MRFTIRVKQIAGVTAIVGLAVVALSALYVARLADVVLHESYSRGAAAGERPSFTMPA